MTQIPNCERAPDLKLHLTALHAERVDIYCRLFIAAKATPKSDVGEHADAVLAAGLCRVEGSNLVPQFLVSKVYDLFVATDLPTYRGSDRVLYLADQDSLLLARNLPELDGGIALDIGTGSGVQALSLLVHGASRVTAIDLNPRALAFARFNATINGLVDRIEFVHTSFADFQPQARYDLVLSNLPFVPVPDGAAFMLSGAGGLDGLALARQVVERFHAIAHRQTTLLVITQSPGDAYLSEFEKILVDRFRTRAAVIEAIDIFGTTAPIEIQFQPFEGDKGVPEWRQWTKERGYTHQHYLFVKMSPANRFEHRRHPLEPRLELVSLNLGSATWEGHYAEIRLAREGPVAPPPPSGRATGAL